MEKALEIYSGAFLLPFWVFTGFSELFMYNSFYGYIINVAILNPFRVQNGNEVATDYGAGFRFLVSK